MGAESLFFEETMRKKFLFFGLAALFAVSVFAAAGCSSNGLKSPEQLITEAYGDKEYTISFHSDGLDAPVPDISYSANSMPTLPTPERIGYIFEGWYLDEAYTKPYSSGILYLYMCDVTLYAKWSKEEFVSDGVYDIDFSAQIVENSLEAGELAEIYGYRNLAEDIIANETYIEKSGSRLLLRLQYDSEILEPSTAGEGFKSYDVSLAAALNDSDVYLYEKTENYTETVRTMYIDITDTDIDTPIYFNVSTVDWKTKGLTDEERALTKTTYIMSFTVSRLIGFSRPFVDTSVPLDDGYYLVRTFTKKEDEGESMLSLYDPVYSYIIAKDGNYTLVKPTYPYFGITELSVGQLSETYTANYFYRLSTFLPFRVCYEVDAEAVSRNSSKEQDYYPSAYNAGSYRTLTCEFHAATGRSYYVIDMGNSVRKYFILSGSPTGFPEAAVNLGNVNTLLEIDYGHIVKINEIDYTPITGDSYQFEDEFIYYPGAASDINNSGKAYDATEQYGLSAQMVNYFFTASGLNTSYESRKVYDSKITITPSAASNAKSVAESRYALADFKVSSRIYGYDAAAVSQSGGRLYTDSMTLSTFTIANMREFSEKRVGKTFTKGKSVSLASVFAEKCSSADDFKDVTYQAYKMKNGEPDFSSPVTVENSFTFSEELAVLFTWGKDGDKRTSLVELAFESDPDISVLNDEIVWTKSDSVDNVYVADRVFSIGESVPFPTVTYNWGSVNGKFLSDYYSSELFSGETGINPLTVCIYVVENGAYVLKAVSREALAFTITNEYEMIVYELRNQYGERKYIYFECNSVKTSVNEYTVTDSEGDGGRVFGKGKITVDDYGEPKAINVSVGDYLTKENADELLFRTYYYHDGDEGVPFSLVSYTIYTDCNTYFEEINSAMTEDIASGILNRAFGDGYAFIALRYTRGDDVITATYIANVTFSGAKNYEAYDYADWFTGYEYNFVQPALYGVNGQVLADMRVYVEKYAAANSTQLINAVLARESYSLVLTGKQYYLLFNQTGKYRLSYSFFYRLPTAESLSITLYQDVYVSDGNGEVGVIYVTDADHPFSDEIMKSATEYTFSDGTKGYAYNAAYSLTENIATPDTSAFAVQPSDRIFGWAVSEEAPANAAENILAGDSVNDFVSRFNRKEVYLFAIWDKGITVTTTGEGVESQSRRYYLSDDGYYNVRLDDFRAIAPSLYSFIGWTGGFLGTEIKTGTVKVPMPVGLTEEALAAYSTITAEYREQLIAGYYINSEYSDSFFRNETVLDGYYVKAMLKPVGKDGYTFVGWYVASEIDGNGRPVKIAEQAFNMKRQPITTGITNTLTHTANGDYKTVRFAAVFADSEGNLVW